VTAIDGCDQSSPVNVDKTRFFANRIPLKTCSLRDARCRIACSRTETSKHPKGRYYTIVVDGEDGNPEAQTKLPKTNLASRLGRAERKQARLENRTAPSLPLRER
jgi:hypothetical protein